MSRLSEQCWEPTRELSPAKDQDRRSDRAKTVGRGSTIRWHSGHPLGGDNVGGEGYRAHQRRRMPDRQRCGNIIGVWGR